MTGELQKEFDRLFSRPSPRERISNPQLNRQADKIRKALTKLSFESSKRPVPA